MLKSSSIQWLHFDLNLKASTKLGFQMLSAAKASELAPLNHDPKFGPQSLGFLHRVSRQDDRALLIPLVKLCDYRPHKPTSHRIHACGWLVQQHNRGIPKNCYRNLQLAFVSPRKGLRALLPLLLQVHLSDCAFYQITADARWNSFEQRVEEKVLFNSQLFK